MGTLFLGRLYFVTPARKIDQQHAYWQVICAHVYKSVLLELSSRQNIEINRVTYLINIATYCWGAAGLWAQEMEMRASITWYHAFMRLITGASSQKHRFHARVFKILTSQINIGLRFHLIDSKYKFTLDFKQGPINILSPIWEAFNITKRYGLSFSLNC